MNNCYKTAENQLHDNNADSTKHTIHANSN